MNNNSNESANEVRMLRSQFRELYTAGGESTLRAWASMELETRTG